MKRITMTLAVAWAVLSAPDARGEGTHLRWGDDFAKGPDPLSVGVPLEWRPTDDIDRPRLDALRAFKGKTVQVKPFGDDRIDEQLVGQNNQERKPKLVRTKDDVGAWCAAQLVGLLREAKVPVVDQAADLVVTGTVQRLMVDERDVYRGTVALALTVTDAAGKEVWTGAVTGDAKRWGRSYSAENYMETLSDALLHALDEFLIRMAP